MGVALQTVIVGLSDGAVYGLVGLGFTMVWALTRTLALAHGDVVIAAVLIAVLGIIGSTPVALSPSVGDSVALVMLALAAGLVLSVLVYAVAVRPFLDRGGRPVSHGEVEGWVAGTLLAGVTLRAALGLALPASGYAVPDPLHLDGLTTSGVVTLPGGATVPVRVIAILVIGIVVAVAAERFVDASRPGRAMRAVAGDRQAAALCGISVTRVTVLAFVLAGVLAAVAGLLATPDRTVTGDTGVPLGLAAAAAALIGGLGSPRGAIVGGLAVGLIQQGAVAAPGLGASWADVVPLLLLVVVVAVRPEGFGTGRRAVAT